MQISATDDEAKTKKARLRSEPAVLAPSPRRVALVTAGQTPRDDLVPDIVSRLPEPYTLFQYGALDGLDRSAIANLAPEPGDPGFSTRLRTGEQVTISKKRIGDRLARLVSELDDKHFDLIVLLSTGLFRDFESRTPTVNGQRALESAVDALVMSGQMVGLVQPIARQVSMTLLRSSSDVKTHVTYATPQNEEELRRAAADLDDCDIIVLNSVAFDEESRRIVMASSGKPTILARRVIAGAAQLLLRPELSGVAARASGLDEALADRLGKLTDRERQVMSLITEGLSNKAIGRQLGISPRTVEIHRSRVLAKMDVTSSAALIRLVLSAHHADS